MKVKSVEDLLSGDFILRRSGEVELVVRGFGFDALVSQEDGYDTLDEIKDDLTYTFGLPEADIIEVRRPLQDADCCFDIFDRGLGELVYKREEVVEMTLDEICKILGKKIKIVENK